MACVTISQPPKKPLRFRDVHGRKTPRLEVNEDADEKDIKKAYRTQKQTMGWWKSRVHHDEHLEFTENCSMHKAYGVFLRCIEIFRQGEDRIIWECRISHIYIYMYIYKCHIQSTRKAMTGLLQRGWTPLSLCHRYDCRKLVLKWHPDKHPEGRGVVPSVDYVTLRADDEDHAAGLQVMWKTYLLDFKVWNTQPSTPCR